MSSQDDFPAKKATYEVSLELPSLTYQTGLRDRRASSFLANDPRRAESALSSFRASHANNAGNLSDVTFEEDLPSLPQPSSRRSQLSRPALASPLPSYYTVTPSGSQANSRAPSRPSSPSREHDRILNSDASAVDGKDIVLPPSFKWRMISAMLSYGTAGWADGTPGAILPFVEKDYGLTYIQVSTIFVCSTCGFLVGTFLNEKLIHTLGLFSLPFTNPSAPSVVPRWNLWARYQLFRGSEHGHSLTQGRCYTLTLACLSQIIYFSVAASHGPFYSFVIAFFFGGFGISLLTGQLNAFFATAPKTPGKFLGFLHAGYGMGALLSPLIATSLIARAGWPWHRFYYLSLALACINTVFSRLAFAPDANERKGALDAAMATRSIQLDSLAGRSGRVGDEEGSAETSVDEQDESEVAKVSSLEAGSALGGEALPALNGREHDGLSQRRGRSAGGKPEGRSAKPKAMMSTTLRYPFVWVMAFFLLATCGYETTTGGWIVTYMLKVRGADIDKAGYIASGFWGGLTLGRIVTGFISPYLSPAMEKHSIHVYLAICLILDLVIWQVPSVLGGGISTALIGFCQGPIFPIAVGVSSRLLPQNVNMTALSILSSSASVGSAIWPFALGALASAKGVAVLQPFLLALLGTMAVFWSFIPVRPGKPDNLNFDITLWPRKVKGLFRRG